MDRRRRATAWQGGGAGGRVLTSCSRPPAGVPEVLEARGAYLTAREKVRPARLALGRAIAEARAKGIEQAAIAKRLGLTREQIRRYQAEYEKSLSGES